ncbi:winged helix-turn-helix domain-containing protein [Solwaraspora sp. WMMA2080]|uniref:winged helix-turn-helix domain-containing protein n=1 Tax=unclassified Solwaraspora TaxID=2627926 RepID=UPI00248CDAFC|nr:MULTISPECIES: winged helix-turn-helix domain-containing protein [unclassified Solwaraspora]WBB95391.1 winged helix-turn-helix domain-containing protein [Solwaraspora sp. WMMA2059]WBC20704.1 winged helix-turn-helix domain-containing protein [Solwaraspora sp. WMMA2080]
MTNQPDNTAANDVRDRQRQIAADLRRQILTGEFTPGDKVPSTAQLCQWYGVSNLATQRALNILKKQGFVRGESGVGVFVTANQPIAVEANHYPGRRTDRSHRDDQSRPPAQGQIPPARTRQSLISPPSRDTYQTATEVVELATANSA